MSTLKPKHIMQSTNAELILSTIGSLSPSDLLSAVHSLEHLQELALNLVDLYQAVSKLTHSLTHTQKIIPERRGSPHVRPHTLNI